MWWWHLIAHETGQQVDQLKKRTRYRKFMDWVAFYTGKQFLNRFDPMHYYMAQLTAELVRCHVTEEHRSKVKLENYLLEFGTKEPPKAYSELDEDEQAARIAASKAVWAAARQGAVK